MTARTAVATAGVATQGVATQDVTTQDGRVQEVPSRWSAAPAPALRPLGPGGRVRLLPGPLADRLHDCARTYLDLDPDSVLKGFREQAGLPAPGEPLGGWAARTSEATFGQWVSGLARLGAVLDDDRLRSRAVDLVDGWAATLKADGDARMATYGWDKVAGGLVDTALHTGHPGALDVLVRITEAAARTVDRSRSPATPTDRDGRRPHGTLEWYTLPENLYRGYLLTGEPRLQEFAQLWHYDAYWDRFAQPPAPGQPWDVPVWRHAYSHVNTFASVAALHRVTGEQRLLDVLRTAHDWATGTQCYATGGYGPGEWSVPDDGTLGRALERRTDSAEITCGSWAAFKLCSALLETTGEARYADWAERLVHSGLGATVPVRPDGRTPYYADYRLGVSTKLPHWDAWPCCSGTYPQAVSHLVELLYHATADGLAVTLLAPSEVTWSHRDQEVTVRQETGYPTTGDVRLRVGADAPVAMALRVRVPPWARHPRLTLAGEVLDVPAPPGGWAVVDRTWHPGDELRLQMDLPLRAEAVDTAHPHRVALARGPVVLAQETVFAAPLAAGGPLDVLDVEDLLVPDTDDLHLRPAWRGAAEQPVGSFRPLAEIPERWPHRVYHDLDDPRVI